LLESAYEACPAFELAERGHKVEQRKPPPVVYRYVRLDGACRLDLRIDNKFNVELKAVDRLAPIHEAQLRSYLKLSGCKVRLLVNVIVILLENGLRRVVHDFPD
jgi:GxxExxY protein